MAKNEIKVGRDVIGVVVNKRGKSVVHVGDRIQGQDVRAAVAQLLRVAESDPKLTPDQAVTVRDRAKDLQAETNKKQKRWNKDALAELLGDISRVAAATVATAGAVEAVRGSLGL